MDVSPLAIRGSDMYWHYDVFGVTVRSNVSISSLLSATSAPRAEECVEVHLVAQLKEPDRGASAFEELWYVSPHRDHEGNAALTVWRSEDKHEYRLLYDDGTEFVVERGGTQIWGSWPPSLTLEDAIVYLVGPVLGFAVRLQGVTCLHACAVGIDGCAVALVGEAGAGKSTTASAFAKAGYGILTEDIVALSYRDHRYWVLPGYPEIRLWPGAVRMLYGTADALPRIVPTWEKRKLDLLANGLTFEAGPLPLERVYVLRSRQADTVKPSITQLSAGQGVVALLANSYGHYLLNREARAQEFETLGQLVSNIPVYSIVPSADPAKLSELYTAIVYDFRNRLSG